MPRRVQPVPNGAGIKPGDWAWFEEDGITLRAIGPPARNALREPIPRM